MSEASKEEIAKRCAWEIYLHAWGRCYAFLTDTYDPGDELSETIRSSARTHFEQFWEKVPE